MATNPGSSLKNKASVKKSPAKSKSTSKPAKKTASKLAKRPAKSANAAKPVIKPKTVVKSVQKDVQTERKAVQASAAFEKKIDQMAQRSTEAVKPENKSKSLTKIFIGAIIIIVLAIIVYLFYPGRNSSVVKEEGTPKEVPPASPVQEAKTAESVKTEAKAASDVVIHKVIYKDQLTEISKQYYGSHKDWKRIYEANKDKINDPNLIFPGQEFVIPKIEK